jgi:hypothetical protein
MSVLNSKTLKVIICGILAISIVSIAYAGAGAGDAAVPPEQGAVQTKVGASNVVSSGGGVSGANAGDYFPEFDKIRVDPNYKYLDMEPGDKENFTVTVENRDNKTIKLNPRIVITPYTQNFINESWVDISPSDGSLKPGEEQEFKVNVNIPEDADIGSYAVMIAFVEKVPEGDVAGYYSNFPGTMQLNVQVTIPPVVQILTPYVNDLVEAGNNYTYEIKLKNTGDREISLAPEITKDGGIIYERAVSGSSVPSTEISYPFGNDAISLEAPKTIKAGETAIVKLNLAVPAEAKGSYTGTLKLNLDDPGIYDGGMVPLSFRILPVVKEPYQTTFKAGTGGPITIEVKAYQYGYDLYTATENRNLIPTFNVSLKNPSGEEVTPTLVNTQYIGSISIIDDTYPQPRPLPYMSAIPGTTPAGSAQEKSPEVSQGRYQGGATTFVETYTVPGAIGDWTLSILPKNTENFEYSIKIGTAEK